MYTGPVKGPCRLATLLVVALLTGLAGSRAGAQEVVEATLDNGLRVLLQEDHRSPVASFQIWYRVGSRDERVGLTGLSHYLEHMMFKGTPTYGPRVYLEADRDRRRPGQRLHEPRRHRVSRDRRRRAARPRAGARGRPDAPPAPRSREVDAERKVVLEERRTRTEDDPVGALAELFNTIAFVAHPYRLPTIGLAQDVERLTAQRPAILVRHLLPAQQRDRRRGRGLPGGRAPGKIRTRFGAIPGGATTAARRGGGAGAARRAAGLAAEGGPAAPSSSSGYPVPNHRSPDAYPLEVLSAVLSGGRDVAALPAARVRGALALEAGGRLLAPHPRSGHVHLLRDACCPDRAVDEAERALERRAGAAAPELDLRRGAPARPEPAGSELPLRPGFRLQPGGDARAPRAPRRLASQRGLPAGSGPSRARTCGEWPSAISYPSAGRRPSCCRRLRPPSQ